MAHADVDMKATAPKRRRFHWGCATSPLLLALGGGLLRSIMAALTAA